MPNILDPQQQAQEEILQSQMGPLQGLPPRNGGGIMGALRGLGQRIQSVDPLTWAMISGGIGSARGGSPIGNIMSGVTQGLAGSQQMQSLKERAQYAKEDRENRKFASDELRKSITESLKNLDTNADGVVTPEEKKRGDILRNALALAGVDPAGAAKMVADVSTAAEQNSIGAVQPGNYDPASIDIYRKSGNYSDLKPVEPYQVVQNKDGTVSLYDRVSGARLGGGRSVDEVVEAADVLGGADAKREFNISYPSLANSARAAKSGLQDLLTKVKAIPSGPGAEAVMTKLSAEYQVVESALKQAALEQIAALANKGVKLNPITEEELRVLFSTSAQLTNYPEANAQIIERQLRAYENVMKDLEHQKAYYEGGGDPLKYEGRSREEPKTQQPQSKDGWRIVE